jgi:hypothetical protein
VAFAQEFQIGAKLLDLLLALLQCLLDGLRLATPGDIFPAMGRIAETIQKSFHGEILEDFVEWSVVIPSDV